MRPLAGTLADLLQHVAGDDAARQADVWEFRRRIRSRLHHPELWQVGAGPAGPEQLALDVAGTAIVA